MPDEMKRTAYWRGMIAETNDIESLRELLSEMEHSIMSWSEFLDREMISRGVWKNNALAARAGVNEKTVGNWINKNMLPKKRNTFIAVAMALSMNVEETNYMLIRYGGHPKLYVKDLNDALCIYAISSFETGTKDALRHADCPYGYVEELIEKVVDLKINSANRGASDQCALTEKVEEGLLQCGDDGKLLAYLKENGSSFVPFVNLSDLIEEINAGSTHSLVTLEILPTKFDKVLSKLRQQHIAPTRESLITYGIVNDMTVNLLDSLLEYAKMDPLRANRPEEMALIYAINAAHFYNRQLTYDMAEDILTKTNDAKIRAECKRLLDQATNSVTAAKAAFPYDSVYEYVQYVFSELKMEAAIRKYCPDMGDMRF